MLVPVVGPFAKLLIMFEGPRLPPPPAETLLNCCCCGSMLESSPPLAVPFWFM